MSRGTTVRSFRLPDQEATALVEWGKRELGLNEFSAIVRHLILSAIDGSATERTDNNA